MNKALIVALLLILPAITGCVEIQEAKEKVQSFLKPSMEYKWVKKVNEKADFGLFDIINSDMAKVDNYPFMVENGTEFLHIYIHCNFSKPFGKINIIVVSPEKNTTKEYSTLGKSYQYDDFIYFDSPIAGNWKIVVKVTGIGDYRLIAEAYQHI